MNLMRNTFPVSVSIQIFTFYACSYSQAEPPLL